eukprot:2043525-Amphidinium_carterae.1
MDDGVLHLQSDDTQTCDPEVCGHTLDAQLCKQQKGFGFATNQGKDSPFSKDVAPAGSRLSNEQWQQLQQVLLNEFTQVSPFNQPPFYSDPHKDKAQRVVSQLEQQFGCVFKYDCFWDNYHFPTKCWCHLVTMQWQ